MADPRTIIGMFREPFGGCEAGLFDILGHGEDVRPKLRCALAAPASEPIGAVYRRVLTAGGVKPTDVLVVGVAGQDETWEHLLKAFARPVSCDFDLAERVMGGNGFGIFAWPDWRLLHHERWSRVLVHLGDVASMSVVGSAAAACEVQSFHLGPGMAMLEQFGPEAEDSFHAALLNELSAHPYFRVEPPKSTNPYEWAGRYVERLRLMAEKHNCDECRLVATLEELVAWSVENAVGRLTERPHDVILCGRGAERERLAARIRRRMCPSGTVGSEKIGLSVRAVRPAAAAMLAAARLDGYPAHVPSAGGADSAVCLGRYVKP